VRVDSLRSMSEPNPKCGTESCPDQNNQNGTQSTARSRPLRFRPLTGLFAAIAQDFVWQQADCQPNEAREQQHIIHPPKHWNEVRNQVNWTEYVSHDKKSQRLAHHGVAGCLPANHRVTPSRIICLAQLLSLSRIAMPPSMPQGFLDWQ